MDPNETLAALIGWAREIMSELDRGEPLLTADEIKVAENILNLDEWMKKGGSPPDRWEQN